MVDIKLLGKPAINDLDISEGQRQFWNLLLFFLYNKNSSFTQDEVFQALWDESSVTNADSTVKAAIHRFRLTTRSLGEDLILCTNGKYHWNTELEYALDVDEFERLAVSDSLEDRGIAVGLYRGEFLGSLPSPLKAKYHKIYLDTLDALLSEVEPEDILRLTSKPVKPDERIYVHRLKAFMALERFREAALTYEELYNKIMADGISPSEEATALYQEAAEKSGQNITIHSIADELAEKGAPSGCYLMNYEEFKETVRYFKASGITGQIVIFEGDTLPDTLEAKDIAAKIGNRQYAIYLPFESAEDAGKKIDGKIIMDSKNL